MTLKLALFALALTCVVSANPMVLSDPIPVHGSGWFSWSWPGDGYYQLWFTGSDGINTVVLSRTTGALITGTFRETMDTWIDTTYNGCCGGGWGRINDVVSDRAYFSMGRGAGLLTLYDHAGEMLASAPLISSFFIVNYAEEVRSGRVDWRAGDIVITSAPEPGTFALLSIGLLGYLITARFMTRPEII